VAGAGHAAAAADHRLADPRRARKLRTGFEKIDRVWAEVTNVLADTIPGIRVVKAFAQEKREATASAPPTSTTWRQRQAQQDLVAVHADGHAAHRNRPARRLGLRHLADFQNDITVGVLTAFLAYIGRFYLRLDSMSRIVSATQKAAAGAKRIFDILDHVSSVPEPTNPVHLPKVTGRIELRESRLPLRHPQRHPRHRA
jgi:ATP-binding cassette subfamily B protein